MPDSNTTRIAATECPICHYTGGDCWFDRTLCPEPCGMMHARCDECGAALDGCPFEDELPDE